MGTKERKRDEISNISNCESIDVQNQLADYDLYCAIVDEGAARVNYHATEFSSS